MNKKRKLCFHKKAINKCRWNDRIRKAPFGNYHSYY